VSPEKAAYIIVGVILWVSVLKSGVHATLAGVALAFTIPLNTKNKEGESFSLSKEMEHDLHYWVAFFILPLFAFVNAGVDLRNVSLDQMTTGVPLGIMAGLFFGKQIGVFGFSWIAIKLGIAKTAGQQYLVAALRCLDINRHRLHHEFIRRLTGIYRRQSVPAGRQTGGAGCFICRRHRRLPDIARRKI